MESTKLTAKLTLTIDKFKGTELDTKNIFSMTHLGKLTALVDYFESMSVQEVHHCLAEKDEKGMKFTNCF